MGIQKLALIKTDGCSFDTIFAECHDEKDTVKSIKVLTYYSYMLYFQDCQLTGKVMHY